MWEAIRIRAGFKTRQHLPDDAFLHELPAPPSDPMLAAAIRRAFGICCGIAPEWIYPTDLMEPLTGMLISGWDRLSFFTALEIELGRAVNPTIPLPPITHENLFGRRVPGEEPFGKWLLAAEPLVRGGMGPPRTFL